MGYQLFFIIISLSGAFQSERSLLVGLSRTQLFFQPVSHFRPKMAMALQFLLRNSRTRFRESAEEVWKIILWKFRDIQQILLFFRKLFFFGNLSNCLSFGYCYSILYCSQIVGFFANDGQCSIRVLVKCIDNGNIHPCFL